NGAAAYGCSNNGHRNGDWPIPAVGVASSDSGVEGIRYLAKPKIEFFRYLSTSRPRQRYTHESRHGPPCHRRNIAEIDGHRLASHLASARLFEPETDPIQEHVRS